MFTAKRIKTQESSVLHHQGAISTFLLYIKLVIFVVTSYSSISPYDKDIYDGLSQ